MRLVEGLFEFADRDRQSRVSVVLQWAEGQVDELVNNIAEESDRQFAYRALVRVLLTKLDGSRHWRAWPLDQDLAFLTGESDRSSQDIPVWNERAAAQLEERGTASIFGPGLEAPARCGRRRA